MAKRRDIVVAIIIGTAFVVAILFFGLILVDMFSTDDGISFAPFGGNVGVIEVFGAIDENSGRPVIKELDRWAESGSIKAIVLHVNSPGGGVAICQEIYDAIKRARAEKPIVISMASLAASGGYYIACAADRVVANPGTLTGSIGVIMQFHTIKGLLDKVGVETETIKSGELKDFGTYSRPMTKKEELMVRSVVMDTYEQFVSVVAEGRGKDAEEIYHLADGSVFTGLQAYNMGLVDTLGGLNEAVEIAAELANLEGKPKVVRPYRKDRISIFDLLGSLLGRLDGNLGETVGGPELLYLYQ